MKCWEHTKNTNEILKPDYFVPVEFSLEDYTFDYVMKLIEENEKKNYITIQPVKQLQLVCRLCRFLNKKK